MKLDITASDYERIIDTLNEFIGKHLHAKVLAEGDSDKQVRARTMIASDYVDTLKEDAEHSKQAKDVEKYHEAAREFHDVLFMINTARANNNTEIRDKVAARSNKGINYLDNLLDNDIDCDDILVFLHTVSTLMRRVATLYSPGMTKSIFDGMLDFSTATEEEMEEKVKEFKKESVVVPFSSKTTH